MQLINVLPCSWKRNILEDRGHFSNFCVYDNHPVKDSKVFAVNKLNNKELYLFQNMEEKGKTSLSYITNQFLKFSNLYQKNIGMMARIVAINTATGMFQYNILNNI